MSGGVALIDYDGDGWPDIYFTNAQSVDMALHGVKARSALYHNNHDGTFTDVTDKAGVGYPCWAMGAVVGDYNNDGRPDLLVTCLNGVVLYRNNGDGTFTDVTKARGLAMPIPDGPRARPSAITTATDLPIYLSRIMWTFISTICRHLVRAKLASTWDIDVQCGPRGLKGSAGQSLPQQRRWNIYRCFEAGRRRTILSSATD